MALTDEVTNRVSTARLVQLTNQDGEGQTSVNTSRLALASTDAQAEMERVAGVTYSGTNPIHVDLACSGVIAKLQEYGGNGGEFAVAHRDRWTKGLEELRTRQGVPATSSSKLVPLDEPALAPKLDAPSFRGYTASPRGTGDDDPLLAINAGGAGGL